MIEQSNDSGLAESNRFARHGCVFAGVVFMLCLIPVDFAVGYLRNRPTPAVEHGGDPASSGIRVYNEHFHHGFAPRGSETQHWGEAVYVMHTNSLGFKDRSPREIQLETDRYRLIILGDSFAEGIGVPHEETFAGILEQLLDGYGVEVLNASVASYSPKLIFLKLKYWLERGLRFDELAIFYDVSDASDELIYSTFRWDELNARGLAPIGQHFEKGPSGPQRWYEYSLLWRTFQRLAFRQDPWRRDLYRNPGTGETFSYYQERSEWVDGGALYERWGRAGLEAGAFYVRQILQLALQHGFEVTLAIYPWPKEIIGNRQGSKNVEFWTDFAAQEPLELINLYPAFMHQPDPASVVAAHFIERDVHWNPTGHRRIASQWLQAREQLQELPTLRGK